MVVARSLTVADVQSRIRSIVQQEIGVPTTRSGARDVIELKDRVYASLATTMFLRPDVVYYWAWLTKNRLQAVLLEQVADLEELDRLAPGAYRNTAPVRSLGSLRDAVNSMRALEGSLGDSRQRAGDQISRALRQLDQFARDELAPRAVVGSQLVETGESVRAALATLKTAIESRHTRITTLTGAVTGYMESVRQALPPTRALRSVVSRLLAELDAMERSLRAGSGTETDALVFLLASRTVLRAVSAFGPPATARAEGTGVLIDSAGEPAALTGTLSGPFDYVAGSELRLSVDGVVHDVVLSGQSNPELRSEVLTFPMGPLVMEPAFELDHDSGLVVSGASAGTYASGLSAALDLDSIFVDVDVTWDTSTSQLVFRRTLTGDSRSLRLVTDSVDRAAFAAWAFGGGAPYSRNLPLAAADVATDIGQTPGLNASVVSVTHLAFAGEADGTTIRNPVVSGEEMDSDGTVVVFAAGFNFAARGVTTDMYLITSGDTYGIVGVGTDTLTVDAIVPEKEGASFYVGSLLEYPAGSRLRVQALTGEMENEGFYRLVSSEPAGFVVTPALRGSGSLRVTIFSQLIRLESASQTTAGSLEISDVSAGSASLGFTPVLQARTSLSALTPSADPIQQRVRVGDRTTLTSPGATPYEVDVTAIGPSRVEFSPPVPYEAGTWVYATRAAGGASLDTLVASLASVDLEFPIGAEISRLTVGTRYNQTQQDAVAVYANRMLSMYTACGAYVVARDPTAEQAITMLREQGFDRALDYLLDGDVAGFFALDADGVSYTSSVIRKSATTVRSLVPSSTTPRGSVPGQSVRVRSSRR